VKKLTIILAALALFVAQPAAGQSEYPGLPQDGEQIRYITHSGVVGSFTGTGTGLPGSYYVGPYLGAALSYPGSPQFTMYCVDFTTLVNTNAAGWTVNASQVEYGSTLHQAAYLASLFHSTNSNQWAAIHGAIWSLRGAGIAITDPISHYIALAADNFSQVDHRDWFFLASDPGSASQDFLVRYSVPEPGIIVLLLSGLLGVAFVARRRASQLS
jgi:hypothetical protein